MLSYEFLLFVGLLHSVNYPFYTDCKSVPIIMRCGIVRYRYGRDMTTCIPEYYAMRQPNVYLYIRSKARTCVFYAYCVQNHFLLEVEKLSSISSGPKTIVTRATNLEFIL